MPRFETFFYISHPFIFRQMVAEYFFKIDRFLQSSFALVPEAKRAETPDVSKFKNRYFHADLEHTLNFGNFWALK